MYSVKVINKISEVLEMKILLEREKNPKILLFTLLLFCLLIGANKLYSQDEQSVELVSEAIAMVSSDVLTLRDVNISFFIEPLLSEGPALEPQEISLSNKIQNSITEHLVFLEASVLWSLEDVSEDVNKAFGKSKKLKNFSGWKKLEVEEKEIKFFLEKKILAKKLFDLKVTTLKSLVTEEQAYAFYLQNRVNFGIKRYNEVKESIIKNLKLTRSDVNLKEWLLSLHAKHKLHLFNTI